MTTHNVTITTMNAVEFIRELRNVFRNVRPTPPYTTKLMNQFDVTSKKSKLKANKEPMIAQFGVNSQQITEIMKSSEERGSTTFPLIGS